MGKELRETIRAISRRFREADALLAQELDGAAREIGRHGTLEAARMRRSANAEVARPAAPEAEEPPAGESAAESQDEPAKVATRGRYARPPGGRSQ
jgi:hypothetical protein